jgi:protein-S-isoprenylcysteine O-methyltransferase Ste14
MNPVEIQAWRGLALLVAALALCLFLPAWSVRYWQAWLYLTVFAASAVAITVYLMKHDPTLLARRVSVGPPAEREPRQKIIVALVRIAFLSVLIVPALDHRLGWSHVPRLVSLAGDLLMVAGFWVVFRTFRANSYASAIVETVKDQRVISTGPYAVVRHPMYAGALILLTGTPFALGSYWGLLGVVAMAASLIWRLLDEERHLLTNLAGYGPYMARVKYHLIPHVW